MISPNTYTEVGRYEGENYIIVDVEMRDRTRSENYIIKRKSDLKEILIKDRNEVQTIYDSIKYEEGEELQKRVDTFGELYL